MGEYPPNSLKRQVFFEELWGDIDNYYIRPWRYSGAETMWEFVHYGNMGQSIEKHTGSTWTYNPNDETLARMIYKQPYDKTKSSSKKLYPYARKMLKNAVIKRKLKEME